MQEIRYKKMVPEAKTPLKLNEFDAGFDLYATARKITKKYVEYSTGLAFEIPEGYVGFIFPRSSVTKHKLMLKNSIGVIDATYRGEIFCRFHETEPYIDDVELERNIYEVGDRVVQIIFIELPKIKLIESLELSETVRGDGGFGSTGQK